MVAETDEMRRWRRDRSLEEPTRPLPHVTGHAWQASAGSVIGTGGAGGHELYVPAGPPDPPGLASTTVDSTPGFKFTARGLHLLQATVKVHMPTSGTPFLGVIAAYCTLLGGDGDGLPIGAGSPMTVGHDASGGLSFTVTASAEVRPVDGLGLDQAYAVKLAWVWETEGDPGEDVPYTDDPLWVTRRIDNPGAGT